MPAVWWPYVGKHGPAVRLAVVGGRGINTYQISKWTLATGQDSIYCELVYTVVAKRVMLYSLKKIITLHTF